MRGLGVIALMLLVAASAVAAPVKVGPKDGHKGPSLPAVAMPTLAAEEKLKSPTLALDLERKGLHAAATLEWARFAEEAKGPDRAQALEHLAKLSFWQRNPVAGEAYVVQLLNEFPERGITEKIWEAELQATPVWARENLLQRLTEAQPQTRISVAARWDDVWRQAWLEGAVTQSWQLPEAKLLQARLESLAHRAQLRFMVAVGASVVPGLGLVLLGAFGWAALVVGVWVVFGWAFFSACRHRHYAYSLVFAFSWVAVWLLSPGLAGHVAERQAITYRHEVMKTWQDLRPAYRP